jgi:hypothetical protein
MCKHEEKKCPRCGCSFECKVGNVNQCQCNGISFTEEEKKFIGEKYNDCLCRDCLLELKNRYMMFKEKMYWK